MALKSLPADVNAPAAASQRDTSDAMEYSSSRGTSMSIHGSKALGVRMHQWHRSMSDPLYAVGSSFYAGREVSKDLLEAAIDSLDAARGSTAKDERDRKALLRDMKRLLASPSGGACCDDCKDGKECCDEKKPSGMAAIGGARARGEAAAKSSASKTAAAVQRKYGYGDPSAPGVRVVVRGALQEHASKLASTMPRADRVAFIDGYMSAAEPLVFRTTSRRASGAITKTTGAIMAGVGVAALAGAGIAYVALKPRGA